MAIPSPEPGLVISYAYLWHREHRTVAAVEIPGPVKRHLGLDDQRSWIVVSEGNEFLWPGYDLRKVPNTERYDYGFLPPRFFTEVLAAFVACYRAGKRRMTSRV